MLAILLPRTTSRTNGVSRRAMLRGIGSLSASIAGLSVLGGCQFMSPPTATPPRVRRIGYLFPGSRTFNQPSADAFVGKLRELGWTEGDNLAIEWRFAEGRQELVPDLAAELARLPVELIFSAAAGPWWLERQTNGVPIVAGFMADPLAYGIKNLARPGGSVTGFTTGEATGGIKQVELLKTILPQLERLVILGHPNFGPWLLHGQVGFVVNVKTALYSTLWNIRRRLSPWRRR